MTPMPMLRFVPDGMVRGTSVKKHNAVCATCTLEGKKRPPEKEVVDDGAPF
jgi:hypothetical protein